MKITGIEDISVDGGWDPWVFLKMTTDEGITGWAEFSQARGRKGLPLIVRDMASLIIGKDPREVGKIGAQLYSFGQAAWGGLRAMAAGAIENACLDIKAKALGVPVHDLFGGKVQDRLPVYWSHCGMYRARYPKLFEETIGKPAVRSLDDIKKLGEEVRAAGYSMLKTNLLQLDPARLGGKLPYIERGSGAYAMNVEKWLVRAIIAQMEAFQDGAGPDAGLMIDLNFNFKTEGFRTIAKALEPLGLMWVEIDMLDARPLALIRSSSSTPIASLETILGRRALVPFLENQSVDVGIVDCVFNGMAESVRMAAMLDAYEVNVAAHNSHGPLGSMISAQFCSVLPNVRVLEFDVDEVPWRQQLLTNPIQVENGRMIVPTVPGWGADINEEVARAHPLKR